MWLSSENTFLDIQRRMYPLRLSYLLSYNHKYEIVNDCKLAYIPFPLSLRIGLFYCIHTVPVTKILHQERRKEREGSLTRHAVATRPRTSEVVDFLLQKLDNRENLIMWHPDPVAPSNVGSKCINMGDLFSSDIHVAGITTHWLHWLILYLFSHCYYANVH